jgi:NAD(P)-dependent dehydrogenase (short-subunit alcohol dehydrogenase family)/acyl carrier protein
VVTLVRPPQLNIPDLDYLLRKIGQLWLYGVDIDWDPFYQEEKRYRISLPSYPFEGQPYLSEGDPIRIGARRLSRVSTNGDAADLANWFYIPSWKQCPLTIGKTRSTNSKSPWLVFVDDTSTTVRLLERLRADDQEVITVTAGSSFSGSNRQYTIHPGQPHQYERLLDEISRQIGIPNQVIHCWSVTRTGHNQNKAASNLPEFTGLQNLGYYSLLYFVQAVEKQDFTGELQIWVVSNNIQEVTGEEDLSPGKATILSPVKVIPQEYPFITCRSIDVLLPEPGSSPEDKLIRQLYTEFFTSSPDTIIAFRGTHRWVQYYEPVRLAEAEEPVPGLKDRGIYLVTGGLGTIGLILAGLLVTEVRARLVLTGRSQFPPRSQWRQWLDTHDKADVTSGKIRNLLQLEEKGGEVMVLTADAANAEQMQEVVARTEKQWGPINGIIHAAGTANWESFSTLRDITKAECEDQFQAKVYGTLVLEKIFRDKALDFCLLISSISTVLGGLKFTAYAAANLFMDAFVHKYNRLNHTRWLSVAWDGMGPRETAEAFKRMFSLGNINQVVVSMGGNLQTRIDSWIKRDFLQTGTGLNKEKETEKQALYRLRPHLSNPYAAPHSQLEKNLVKLWQDFFYIEQLGIDDDFFELGGDSLKAITLISQIHKKFNVKILLADIFKYPTIKSLSQHLETAKHLEYVSIEPAEKKEYYSLYAAQTQLFLIQRMDAGNISYNITFVLELEGNLKKDKLTGVFNKLVQRHESLRTSFELINGMPMQRVHDNVGLEIEFYELDLQLPGRQSVNILENFVHPFDLSRAPLLRVGLARSHRPDKETSQQGNANAGDKYILMVDIHHIITDGISNNILVQDFMWLYEDEGDRLPRLKLQFKDYSQWYNKRKQKETKNQQKEFWKKEFNDNIPLLRLPTDYPRPSDRSFAGKSLIHVLGKEETAALKRVTMEEEATLFMVLLAIMYILLMKISHQEDIVIGTPSADRTHLDLAQSVGIFLNTLPLRNFPKKEKTFQTFLSEIKQRTLKVFENQDYQFEDIVELLNPDRDMSRNPLFDVMLVMQNKEISQKELSQKQLSHLKIRSFDYINDAAYFDILLNAAEVDKELYLKFQYSTGLFKKKTIENFIRHYLKIIDIVTGDKAIKISEISLLDKDEIHAIDAALMQDIENIDVKFDI